jgi:glycine/D-amino acid oxidase-like deaminating enzyme
MIYQTFDGLMDASHDVSIVGAGPVGISLAVELEHFGFNVLLLESGRKMPDANIQELASADIVSPEVHDDMTIAVARRLGGTSNLWGGICLRFDPVDFLLRPGLVDARWPISYEDLSPFYDRACQHARCGEPFWELRVPGVQTDDHTFDFHTLERAANERKSQVIHRKVLAKSTRIDVRLCATVVDLHFDPEGLVTAIEIVRSDGSHRIRKPVRNLVITAGGLESTRLLLAARRNSPNRFGGADGPLGRYYMAHVSGSIAEIGFLNAKLACAFDYFVDSHGSYVRRRFVPSQSTQLREKILNSAMYPVVPAVADARHGSAILSLVYLVLAYRRLARLIVPDAIRNMHITTSKPVDATNHLLNVVKGLPSAIAISTDFLWRRHMTRMRLPGFFIRSKNLRYRLAYYSEQTPQPNSRVVLSGQNDRMGLPKIRVDLRFHESDAWSVVRTHELFSEWLIRTGFGQLEWNAPTDKLMEAVLAQARHGTHQIGTIRMGAIRKEGVVDRNLSVFDCPNLCVVSTAVLPTSSQANPTLTAIALAMRLAHKWRVGGLPCA